MAQQIVLLLALPWAPIPFRALAPFPRKVTLKFNY
jgi:hypothetical protein